jgi:cell division protein FtsB
MDWLLIGTSVCIAYIAGMGLYAMRARRKEMRVDQTNRAIELQSRPMATGDPTIEDLQATIAGLKAENTHLRSVMEKMIKEKPENTNANS